MGYAPSVLKHISFKKLRSFSTFSLNFFILISVFPRSISQTGLIGFALGTVYQFVLLKIMVGIVYKNINSVPDYNFEVSAFFITLAIFIVFYETKKSYEKAIP